MNKNNKIILASLIGNFFLALLVQVVTGSTTGWMVFCIILASFLPVMINNAKRERDNSIRKNGP